MSQLTSLRKLRLDSAGDVMLPPSLSALTALSSVNLRHCRLEGHACLDSLLAIPSLEVCTSPKLLLCALLMQPGVKVTG